MPQRNAARLAAGGIAACFVVISSLAALAQAPGGAPPSVGVVRAELKPITQTSQFIGRVHAVNRVDIVARVTAFLDKVEFRDGAEVKRGDVLYRLERGPFEADLAAKTAVAQQYQAQLENANIQLQRAQTLLQTQSGAQATVDTAIATQRSITAQLLGAQASVKLSQINLDYTTIASPIDGKSGRTAMTLGNVVTPTSGVLVTVVSQDPMYVLFPVSVRTLLTLRERYVPIGGFNAIVVRLGLPDGRIYNQPGKLDFVDNTVQTSTDTIMVRAVIPNPPLPIKSSSGDTLRELTDTEFVSVFLEGVKPVEFLAVPRAALLSDQQSDYVYVVDADGKAQRQNVKLGQSTPTTAAIESGLKAGDLVIVEGLQRVRPGIAVQASPATPGPPAPEPQK
ncbi:efflux RND transporter periplasmic adaptor subunit [Methylocella silvestris]|uniref:Efflux transporter periplasmic adaptor subunit n=1 Tax=Methylocella silvestris TaxID=199596 RepID=A0A2J7TLI3_METSI|nr:efflux RND transporter periplasmic adaptor subunit [Methylocella silvestris]PNG27632.1 efflux transporter periplasmic adaptor subunit [Methylocella silvestris]